MEKKLLQDILQELKSLQQGQDSMATEIKTLKQGQDSMAAEMRSGFEIVNKKLDTIYAQVAHNTEQEIKLNEVVAKVESLETDNKLIKKLIVNQ